MGQIREHIAPYCFGYFTQYWFGLSGPMPNEPSLATVNANCEIAFARELEFGIQVAVLRNGIIRFSLENYGAGGVVIYREEEVETGRWRVEDAARLQERDYRNWTLAYKLVHVHAVLLDNARRALERCASFVARPNSRQEMLVGYDFSDPIQNLEPSHKFWTPIRDDVIEKSIADLADAVAHKDGLFDLLELFAIGSIRYREHRFPEALIAHWTAIEACINVMWRKLVDDEATDSDAGMPKARKDRLSNSSTYSVAVRIEALYLCRSISGDLYSELQDVRTRRNKWMHELKDVVQEQVVTASKACAMAIQHVFKLDIEGTSGGIVGVGGGIWKNVFLDRYPLKKNYFERE